MTLRRSSQRHQAVSVVFPNIDKCRGAVVGFRDGLHVHIMIEDTTQEMDAQDHN